MQTKILDTNCYFDYFCTGFYDEKTHNFENEMPNLFIIAGCNGAGKTTASYTVLPEVLHCAEFVNADEIAKGLSPFNPESMAIPAGKIMLSRIKDLLSEKLDFAIETTLTTKSYRNFIKKAHSKDYRVSIVFFWLNSPELAINRIAERVRNGGHFVPEDVVRRRYVEGIHNLFDIFCKIVDEYIIIDNSAVPSEVIAEFKNNTLKIFNQGKYEKIQKI